MDGKISPSFFHELSGFNSWQPTLDEWLAVNILESNFARMKKRRAARLQRMATSILPPRVMGTGTPQALMVESSTKETPSERSKKETLSERAL